MLFHSFAEPESGYYIQQYCCHLSGNLNTVAFQNAWQRVINRHPALRSLVTPKSIDKSLQIVRKKVEIFYENQDWRSMSPAKQQMEFVKFLEKDRTQGFEFEKAPVMRLALIRMNEDRYQFIWSFHHFLLDGWSGPLIITEVFSFYEALKRNKSLQLKSPRPYREYIRWLQQQDLCKAEKFWRNDLKGFSTPTQLNVRNSLKRNDHYSEETIQLSENQTEPLRVMARQYRLTLNILLQGAWGLLLSQYSGESDVVFGTTVSGRPTDLEGADEMIGMFLNTLPVRIQVSSERSVLSYMQAIQTRQLAMLQYEYSPLIKIHNWSELPRNQPLFDTIVVFKEVPNDASFAKQKTDIKIDDVQVHERTNFPLTLGVIPGNEIVLSITHDMSQFDSSTISRILRQLKILLEEIPIEPTRPVRSLRMFEHGERNQLLVNWNSTQKDYPKDKNISQLFEKQVEKTPHRTAATFQSTKISYRELNHRANQLARHLQNSGVQSESLVGICIESSLDMLVGLLGIMKAGGTYIPIDPAYPSQRIAFMLEDSGASVLLTQEYLSDQLPEYQGHQICMDRDHKKIEGQQQENLNQPFRPDSLAYVMYTSGSTGNPKGVAIPHRALVNFILSMQKQPGMNEQDVLLSVTTLSFDIAGLELYLPLVVGAQVALVSREISMDGSQIIAELENRGATVMQATPATWQLLLEVGWKGKADLKMLCGGESLPISLANDLLIRGQELWNMYGPTETTIWSTVWKVLPNTHSILIGRPIANTQLYILDSHNQPTPIGISGELHIGGDGLAHSYLHRPKLTKEKFISDKFRKIPNSRLYKTGDLARVTPDGNIECLGRIDFQVKIRGFRIELGEIEVVLSANPQVKQCVVAAREDTPGEKRLVAYVIPEKEEPSMEDLRRKLSEKLADYMLPSAFIMLNQFPLTPNGKIDRRALSALNMERLNEEKYVAPQNEVENQIAEIWKRVLQRKKVGAQENFFDLGGHSLLLAKVYRGLEKIYPGKLAMIDLFRYTTIKKLAEFLSQDQSNKSVTKKFSDQDSHPHRINLNRKRHSNDHPLNSTGDIAVIGLSGRFPGAKNVDEFWQNLQNGVESIIFFSHEELLARGVPKETLNESSYVKAGTFLEDFDQFDANFFGISPNEAEITDPQQRLFLEESWTALESAGYNPETYDGLIGIYAGTGMNDYIFNLIPESNSGTPVSNYQRMIGNDIDFLTLRISYHLNLRGPSFTVQTACSTSLVAIHLACENLLTNRCDIALAGGVSINNRQGLGYIHQEGMISSPDGHCRAFDENAQGLVGGCGLGIVVLKRLSEALEDGDTIRAVIKGSAINNDGSDKIGFTAPAIDGQASVIAEAMSRGKIDPHTINYVETHGTGTPLGDPIEIAALTQAFGSTDPGEKNFCAIGSVKTNIGHLNTAAGVAGMIKTILALEHKKIPPSLNFEKPNPKIDFANSPFFVNTKLTEWKRNGLPRRAGVSSFGLGGTNAHIILEEAPKVETSGHCRSHQLLLLSAKSNTALESSTTNLIEHLIGNPGTDLADVSYTLQIGRKTFENRKIATVENINDAIAALKDPSSTQVKSTFQESTSRDIAFMFPGQGSQYVNMGLDLYRSEPEFQKQIDRCTVFLKPIMHLDFRDVLYPNEKNFDEANSKLNNTLLAQPLLFVIEYSLAKLWMSWGIQPSVLVGHSIGEYVAACLAEVFTVEEALGLVAERGRLIQALPKGSMLAIPLPVPKVLPRLDGKLSLAAVNSPSLCVVSGEDQDILEFERQLAQEDTICQKLHTSHAFHSEMMQPILSPFMSHVEKIDLKPPKIPLLSTVTGTWINSQEMTSSGYWAKNLRQTVLFSDCVEELLKDPARILLEVGPGQTLNKLVQRNNSNQEKRVVLSSLRHPNHNESDVAFILDSLGQLWLAGVQVDWPEFHSPEKRHRLALPTYPFERQRYWIEPKEPKRQRPTNTAQVTKSKDIGSWFYIPSWNRNLANSECNLEGSWLVFIDRWDYAFPLIQRLKDHGIHPVIVSIGAEFGRGDDGVYTVNPQVPDDYNVLLQDLRKLNKVPDIIVHFWGLSLSDNIHNNENGDTLFSLGFYSLIFLTQALNNTSPSKQVRINIVTNNVQEVSYDDILSPEKVTVLGPCKVIPQEHQNFLCRNIDVRIAEVEKWDSHQSDSFLFELASLNTDDIVAYRGHHRWIQSYSKCRLEKTSQPPTLLRESGVYLITGGLGNIGLTMGKYLAQTVGAKLILTGRTKIPAKDERKKQSKQPENSICDKIDIIASIEKLGGQVLVLQADVADLKQMRTVIKKGEERFGEINGVIHAAGIIDGTPKSAIQALNKDECERQFRPKTRGLVVLNQVFQNWNLDFFMLTSSISCVLGGLSFSTYAAANLFLDAFAHEKNRTGSTPWISVNWDAWKFKKVVTSEQPNEKKHSIETLAMDASEGMTAFETNSVLQKVHKSFVSTSDLVCQSTAVDQN